MKLFALDSAGKTTGVALWQDGTLLYESYLACAGTHSETLLSMCDGAFRACGIAPAEIDLFAVNAGPGSFTGLRIGLAVVKGLAFPTDTPCAPVSTLAALAYSWPADGLIATALDARRSEVYCALFRRENGVLTRLTQDGTMPCAEFAALANTHRTHAEPVLCMGDGAHLLCGGDAPTKAASETCMPFDSSALLLCPAPYRFGHANGVCLAALAMAERNECICAAALSPEYHRLSQAERERAQRVTILQKESKPV